MKILKGIVLGLAAIVCLLIAALLFSLFRSVPPLSGRESLPGLGAAVDVSFDSLAIPHISAASDSDAFMALGYLHARERLWSMELMRRTAEGRLSEVMGGATLAADRYLRSLDFARAARASLAAAPPATRALLAAYVRGVNRWIEAPTRALPPEFRVLRFRPEPWTEVHSFEVARLMAWDLVSSGAELQLARAVARVGLERINELLPIYPDQAATIIQPGTGTWGGRTGRGRGGRTFQRTEGFRPSASLAAAEIPAVPPLAEQLLEWAQMSRASNSWVIGGARTASGKPILANDPHLGLRAPSLWYLAAIESPGYTAAGGTIPGLPPVVIGRNRRIAWGLTNIGVDDVDYVIERLRSDSSEVLTAGGWQPVEVERDSIRVKGRAAVPFVMRRTAHGPLVSAAAPGADSAAAGEVRVLAMRWNGHDPGRELDALLGVGRAGTWDEFLAALHHFKAPEQNWIYADVDGNIGYTTSGAVPVRRGGQGLLPTAGWTDEGLWERYLDFEELPRVYNPPEGFVVTANNRVVGSEYPAFLTADWEAPYRAQRIRQMVVNASRVTADDVRQMQMDTLDLFARATKHLAAQAAEAIGRPGLADSLREWDGTAASDRVEPTVFWTWYRQVRIMTFDDELDGVYRPTSRLHRWLQTGSSPWFDDVRTPQREGLAVIMVAAMRRTLEVADGMRWGDVHITESDHAMSSVAPLNLALRLSVRPAGRGGSPYTVNVAGFSENLPPFHNTHAASLRFVVDLAEPERGAMIITTGQSGHPVSRHYRDQVSAWWAGLLAPLPLSSGAVRSASVLRLVP